MYRSQKFNRLRRRTEVHYADNGPRNGFTRDAFLCSHTTEVLSHNLMTRSVLPLRPHYSETTIVHLVILTLHTTDTWQPVPHQFAR
jgi:hypothetical protein